MQIEFGRIDNYYLKSLPFTLYFIVQSLLFPVQSYAQGCQSPDFETAVNFNVNLYPASVTIGDFNLDGNPDAAVANSLDRYISLLFGDGNGKFSNAINYNVGGNPTSITSADFNNDSFPDLATISSSKNSGTVLFGDGTGNYSAGINFIVGKYPTSVAVGDFNGDNAQDLVVANYNLNKVSVLLNNGSGSFSVSNNFTVAGYSTSVTVGDFNKDGNSDIAVANSFPNNISILLGDGTGNFGTANNITVGRYPTSIKTDDFNKDGNLDLAVANSNSHNVSVLLGDGNGNFTLEANFGAGTNPWSITTADVNGDDNPDLAVTNYSSNNVSVMLGDGTGRFGTASNFNTGNSPLSIASNDLNKDGSIDFTVANYGSDSISVFLNACGVLQINQPPVAICQNLNIPANANCEAEVSPEEVDNGSFDPDGDELTFSLSPAGPYPIGETEVTLTVSDGQESNACTATITVTDESEPILVAISNPIRLWPPDHYFENISVSQLLVSVTANCNTITEDDVYIVSVSSDEADNTNSTGDANTINDIVISPDCKSVHLRKERQGSGNGRVYSIILAADNGNGIIGSTICFVTVPQSRNGNFAVNDGAAYSVYSSCGGSFAKNNYRQEQQKPEDFQLGQNYPNPFNPSTNISYEVTKAGYVNLSVYNILGEEVAVLVDQYVAAGSYQVSFDASRIASGLYLYKLQLGDQYQIKKMQLAK
ncbi:MAG: FG-GAP-like repeat-containing protein [Ignavibacteriaceae bacterium]